MATKVYHFHKKHIRRPLVFIVVLVLGFFGLSAAVVNAAPQWRTSVTEDRTTELMKGSSSSTSMKRLPHMNDQHSVQKLTGGESHNGECWLLQSNVTL
jgi:hypothetical protein